MNPAARLRLAPVLAGVLAVTACASIGPGSIARDQFDYNAVIGESWQRQMLLNIVKLRYGDTPVFLEVSSVVSQYQLQGVIGVDVTNSSPSEQELGATGSYIDKPTISYNPIKGQAFTRSLLTPAPLETVFSLVSVGWPADLVMRVTLRSVNSMYNRVGDLLGGRRTADPEFEELIAAMRRIQAADAVGMRVEKRGDHQVMLMTFQTPRAEEVRADILRVRELVGIDGTLREIPLVFSAVRESPGEVAILTRSMLEIMSALSSYIDVPESHIAEQRVSPDLPGDIGPPLIRVLSDTHKPSDAFVAVPYRGHWFWVEDTDLDSKRMFTILVLLFSLVETGDISPVAPVLTIPAG